jgi:hypothetical protein
MKLKENYYELIAYTFIWLFLYVSSGLLFSGWHMMEDHEILELYTQNNGNNFNQNWGEVKTIAKNRLSPLLDISLYIGAVILGTKFWMWHLVKLILVILSSFLTFNLLHSLSQKKYLSFFAPFFLFLGTASEIITRIATIEVFSLFIIILCFYLVNTKRFNFILFCCIIIACFTKENLILAIPSLFIFYYYISQKQNEDKDIIRSNFLNLSIFVFISLSAISIRLLFIDHSNNESQYVFPYKSLSEFFQIFSNFFNYIINRKLLFIEYFLFFTVLALLFVNIKENLKGKILLVLFFISLFITQFVLYLNVGFSGRYFVPANLSFILLFGLFLSYPILYKGIFKISILLLFSLLFFQLYKTTLTIERYVYEGESIKNYLKAIAKNCPSGNCKVLLSGDKLMNLEMFQALIRYTEYTKKDVYIKLLPLKTNQDLFFKHSNIIEKSQISLFEHSFDKHYKNYTTDSISIDDFDIKVLVGESNSEQNPFNERNVKNQFGEEWFTFTFY